MVIFFAGNVSRPPLINKWEIGLMLHAGLRNRLFSFFYHEVHRIEQERYLYSLPAHHPMLSHAVTEAERIASISSCLDGHGVSLPELLAGYNFDNSNPRRVFMDSGAFSAMTKGRTLDLIRYADFLHERLGDLWAYANLDVIGDPAKSLQNLHALESRGLNPVPVFHFTSDFQYLKELLPHYNYIGLGGLVGQKPHAQREFFGRVFSIAPRGTKFHALGMTSAPLLEEFPFYSADSSAWLEGGQRSTAYFFEESKLLSINTRSKKEASHRSIHLADHAHGTRWYARIHHNVGEWLKFEHHITDLWKQRGITWDAAATGNPRINPSTK